MRHFFTKDTVEASIYCRKCGKDTIWSIKGGRPAYCIACYPVLNKLQSVKPPEPEKQGDLFADAPPPAA